MNAIRSILFPSDLSPASEQAFAHARLFAERLHAPLTLYHAVEIPWQVYAREADHDAEVRARYAAEARRSLTRLAAGAPVAEMLVDDTVSAPSVLVDVALLELIRRRQPDLVVMATHARRGPRRAFIGSVAEQVVHHSGRAVLCVPPDGVARLPYRRILIPTDLSPASRRAFAWAPPLAAAFDAEVVVVHVPVGQASTAPADELRRFVGDDLKGTAFEARVLPRARPWSAIAALAEEWPADLVLMASEGHDSVGDHILGSTTDRVIRSGVAPVLVV